MLARRCRVCVSAQFVRYWLRMCVKVVCVRALGLLKVTFFYPSLLFPFSGWSLYGYFLFFFSLLKDSGSEIIGKIVTGKVDDGVDGSGFIYIHIKKYIFDLLYPTAP